LDYGLDFIGLVPGDHGKTISLATNAFVFTESHQHATGATIRLPAFALELELLVRGGPFACALVESSDPIVH
jgi:hypothetical protein